MAKLYTDKSVAEAIAATMSQGKKGPHVVIEVAGGFNVISEKDLDKATAPAAPEGGTTSTVTASSEAAPAKAATKQLSKKVVSLDVPGAKITNMYVITGQLGKRPRWFERKRLVSATPIKDGDKTTGVRIKAEAHVFTSRGLGELIKDQLAS